MSDHQCDIECKKEYEDKRESLEKIKKRLNNNNRHIAGYINRKTNEFNRFCEIHAGLFEAVNIRHQTFTAREA